MIQIEDTDVYGWEAAIRGVRNPMNSWSQSDTKYDADRLEIHVGPCDMVLMSKLSKAGNDHGKFLRMINVTCDITAPLYWWKQFDTYRAGVEKNSCSTMHKIHAKQFTEDDFSIEALDNDGMFVFRAIVASLNQYRIKYNETDDKAYWYRMVQMLPTSYNQRRTVQMSYAAIKTMYHARKSHKLTEWRDFCKWAETLPLFTDICV